MCRIFEATCNLPQVVGRGFQHPSVLFSDHTAVIPSLTLNIPLTKSDRGDGPISEARFLVPVSNMSIEDFTDIVS